MLILKPEDTRSKNAITILHLLMKKDSISRVDLSRTTGLTKTTISSIINKFIALSLVEESSTISTGNVGKNPIPLRIRTDAVHTIGIHLGRQKVKSVLMDARMNIISKTEGLSYERPCPKEIFKSLFLSIDDSLKEAEKRNIKVGAIGIGVPGPLDARTGVVKHPPKFKGWKDVPLGKIVQERYNKLPVWIENDANVGVLAEKWHGGGRDLRNFVYILANEGMGAGVVIDNKLYQGAYDYVGEIGHMLFYDHGKFRYLEDISGVDNIIKRARSKGLDIKNIGDMQNYLQANNKAAKSIVRDIAPLIGSAVINVIHIIGPEEVFIGGKMAGLGDALLQPIKEIVSQYLFGDQEVEVKLSEISEDAVAVGAAINATTKWLEKKSIEHAYAERRWEKDKNY